MFFAHLTKRSIKMKKPILLILAIFLLSLITCDDNNNTTTHTHTWEWVVTTPATPTADGLETETCKTC
jgi:hypothetical protein